MVQSTTGNAEAVETFLIFFWGHREIADTTCFFSLVIGLSHWQEQTVSAVKQEETPLISAWARAWRIQRKLSLREAAKESGIQYNAFDRLERGEDIGAQNLWKLMGRLFGK